jgi:hypothetical protein
MVSRESLQASVQNYQQALDSLKQLDPDVGFITPSFIETNECVIAANVVIQDQKKLTTIQALTDSCALLLKNFNALKKKLSDEENRLYQEQPHQLQPQKAQIHAKASDLVTQAQYTYLKGISFANALFLTTSHRLPELEDIQLIGDLIQEATAVLSNPQDLNARKNLETKVNELNFQLETNPYFHGLLVVGRAFVGALGCLLGAAVALASIFTGVGLLLTLGVGLFTWGKHWGPLTVGKQLCSASANLMFGGPTKHQRNQATQFAKDLKCMNEKGEELNQAMRQPQ